MDLLCLITFFLSTYSFLSYELIDQLEADSSRQLSRAELPYLGSACQLEPS